MPKSYKMEVATMHQGAESWGTNSCRYATEQEAKDAGAELLTRWMVPHDYRATPSEDAVNYCFKDGRSQPLEPEM